MDRVLVSLDPTTLKRARAEARRRGVSFAELCRRALEAATSESEAAGDQPWMEFAGAVASGDANASRTVNDVVYGRHRP